MCVCVSKQNLSPTCEKKQTKKEKENKKNSQDRVANQIKKKKKEKRISPLPANDDAPWQTSSRTDQSFGHPTLRVMALRPCGTRAWHSALAVLAPSTIVTLHFRVISPSVSVEIVARLPPSVVPCGAQPLLSARPCNGYILALLHFCTCTFALAHPCGAQHLAVHAPLPQIGPTAKSPDILTTPFQEVVICLSACSSSNLLVGPCQT